MSRGPLDALNALRARTDSVLVGLSRGKDSLALLDLCVGRFARVVCYHMHLVPGLSFVEPYLDFCRRRWGVEVRDGPHWMLSRMLRGGTYRAVTADVPRVGVRHVERHHKVTAGVAWVATGQKACDSLQRRGMVTALERAHGSPLDPKAGVAYPLSFWTDRQVTTYLKARNVPLPADYAVFGSSYSCDLGGRAMGLMKRHFPEDFARVKATFPFVEAAVLRHELGRDGDRAGARRVAAAPPPGFRRGAVGAGPDRAGPL